MYTEIPPVPETILAQKLVWHAFPAATGQCSVASVEPQLRSVSVTSIQGLLLCPPVLIPVQTVLLFEELSSVVTQPASPPLSNPAFASGNCGLRCQSKIEATS